MNRISRTKSLPRIPSKQKLLTEDGHSLYRKNSPYTKQSSSAKNNILLRSKSKLHRHGSSPSSMAYNRAQSRPHTTKNPWPRSMSAQRSYANWGMKVDSTEALREQILSLKKNLRQISDENVLIKTEKRRLEKSLHRNDRKLKRLLNTVVADKKSLAHGDESRKYSSTELLDELNTAHNSNMSLKRKLHQSEGELLTLQTVVEALHERQKAEIESQHFVLCKEEQSEDANEAESGEQQTMIEDLEQQIESYKSEAMECHVMLETLSKENEDALAQLAEKDSDTRALREEYKGLQQTVENEQFFNRKILDEITAYNMENQQLTEKLNEQKQTELHSQTQIKKLSDKLFGIECELKESIAFYQIFEKICQRQSQFVDAVMQKAQLQNQPYMVALAESLKRIFEQVESTQSNDELDRVAHDYMQEITSLFDQMQTCTTASEEEQQPAMTNSESEILLQTNTIDSNDEKQNISTPARKSPAQCEVKNENDADEKLQIIRFKSPQDTHKEIIGNKKIQRSVTLSEQISCQNSDDASSMSLYDAVIEIQSMQSKD